MKRIYGLSVALFLLSSFNTCLAGSCVNCSVESIGLGPGFDQECPSGSCALIRLKSNGNHFVRDICSVAQSWHFALDISGPTGKATLQQLMRAHDAGRQLVIVGNGKCSVYSNGTIEDVSKVYHYWEDNKLTIQDQVFNNW